MTTRDQGDGGCVEWHTADGGPQHIFVYPESTGSLRTDRAVLGGDIQGALAAYEYNPGDWPDGSVPSKGPWQSALFDFKVTVLDVNDVTIEPIPFRFDEAPYDDVIPTLCEDPGALAIDAASAESPGPDGVKESNFYKDACSPFKRVYPSYVVLPPRPSRPSFIHTSLSVDYADARSVFLRLKERWK